jgi:DNA-binding MarR family transcriptional regulator
VSTRPGGVGFLLGVCHRRRRAAWARDLADLGLHPPQAALLRLAADQPGLGVRQAARALGTDPMHVQRLAAGLLEAGLLEVRPDPADQRRRPLVPSPAGARLALEVARRAEAAEARLAAALGPGRYEGLLRGLEALAALEQGEADPEAVDPAETPTGRPR